MEVFLGLMMDGDGLDVIHVCVCVCASSGQDVEKGLECCLKWKGEFHSIQTVNQGSKK